jgi:hypothetical protein
MAQNGDSQPNEIENVASEQPETQVDELERYRRSSKMPFIIFLKDLRYDLIQFL